MTDRISIDLESGEVIEESGSRVVRSTLDSPEGFAAVSRAWLRAGWQCRHVYTFTWLGRPIIQLPEDMFRVQEAIHAIRPDVIIETGVAHGGSLVFYAALCRVMGRGRVIGVDIEIRPRNREAIESHELADLITLVQGDSAAPPTVDRVRSLVQPDDTVFVMLDGSHARDHVLAELKAYAPLVSVGSYIVAADGIMRDLAGLRRHADTRETGDWSWNNPRDAVEAFLETNGEFEPGAPPFEFNESPLADPVSYWTGGWLKRIRPQH
ncbi:MAG: CmcI family methyltransferase [Gammaproteobacteria bacterium]|nr:CmcI family methyltransferase [Gammaproteobacteria bacterium]